MTQIMLINVPPNTSIKKWNYAVCKAIHTGHPTYTDCYTNYRILLLWCYLLLPGVGLWKQSHIDRCVSMKLG